MPYNISGNGLEVQVYASKTFPIGITVTEFTDDSDPLDSTTMQIADKAMGLNGDLISWGIANPIPVILNVIPGSDDDINLGLLAGANRIGRGKTSAKDLIRLVILYPDDKTVVLTNGVIVSAMFANSVQGSGRIKTKAYEFAFENTVSA